MQKCRLTTPSQDAGMIVLSMGGWDTHLSALGLQTQQAQETPVTWLRTHPCPSPLVDYWIRITWFLFSHRLV
jgi:hypothetical protein